MSPRAERPHSDDVRLVQRALEGRRDGVEAFLRRMRCVPRMLTSRNAKLGRPLSDDELDDVVQETLAAVWRKLPTFDGRASLETWVHQFCFYELLRRLRSKGRLPMSIEDLRGQGGGEPLARADVSALEFEEVLEALSALENSVADVLRLKHFEAMTFEEIGKHLAISPNTVKSRYYRGLSELRSAFGQRTAEGAGRRPS